MREHLPHGVRRPLKPVRTFLCLLGREYLDKPGREPREAIRLSDVAVQRGRIVLRENKDLCDSELMQFETGTSMRR